MLDLRGLRKSYGARLLLDGVDLSIHDGEKVGIVGRNGSGKSTLFRILAGDEGMDAGTLALRRGTRVGYLPQDPAYDPGQTIVRTVSEGWKSGTDIPDEWDRGHRIETILTRLGVDGWDRTMGSLSGGERRRVALARTLLPEPDLLLLDEPTNHLDAATILWLEETLFDSRATIVLVTHDRYFLDRVVDRIVEVSTHGLASFDGGYTDYLSARLEREARLRVEEERRVKLIEKELAWARRSPPARTGKQKARRARARELAGEQRERERSRTREVELETATAPRLGRTILELDGVSKGYDGNAVLTGVTDRLLAGERIGVVGPNGAGKSTLLRLIAGEDEPDAGTITLGVNTRLAYLDQTRELDPALSVARAVSDRDWVELGGRRMHLRAYLDRFLFSPEVHDQKVGALSGGERNRILLARLFLSEFNLLLLDEPTNDLDLDTLGVLEELLEAFEGCLVVVSHDRYLLDRICTSLLVFEEARAVGAGTGLRIAGGTPTGSAGMRVVRHHGSWDAYLARTETAREKAEARRKEAERKERDARAEASREARLGGDGAGAARPTRARLSWKEEREFEELGRRIEALETEQADLSATLADPAFYAADGGAAARDATKRHAEVGEELEAALLRWMELGERAGG